jgi:ATP/maltotriose-dependent transcriptional regulator MalT
VKTEHTAGAASDLAACRRALALGDWSAARAGFEASVDQEQSAEAPNGPSAAWWIGDVPRLMKAQERAYQLYRERGERLPAARVALSLARAQAIFRGELAVASEWLERARELVRGLEPSAVHGWLALREAEFYHLARHDTGAARRLASQAGELALRLGAMDLQMEARALEGLTLIREGQIPQGMRRLDQAAEAAVGGEISNYDVVGQICCHVIAACDRTGDYDRAAEWCQALRQACRHWSLRPLLTLCRQHDSALLILRGHWNEAEAELQAASLEAERFGSCPGSILSLRLAELRRRQGRGEDAATLYDRARPHPVAELGLASLALESGDAAAASERVEHHLRTLPAEQRLERAPGLALAVRVRIALGDLSAAEPPVRELRSLAARVRTRPMEALASTSEGELAFARGDFDRARRCYENAAGAWGSSGLPLETGQARMALGRTLLETGRVSDAVTEVRTARNQFATLGATGEERKAAALLREIRTRDDGA